MTIYADLTSEEQRTLRAGVRAAAVAVSAASPGRKEETVSEGYAAAEFVLRSRPDYVANPLVTSLIVQVETELKEEQPFPDYFGSVTAADALEGAMAALRAAVQLVDAKASPDEAAGYKRWLMDLARVTAEAGKEDQGFLGRGGILVNDAERAALESIAEVLGVEASAG